MDHECQEVDKKHKWCKFCHINHLKNNFTNWTSGNEIIDNFIQHNIFIPCFFLGIEIHFLA
jgi:hypothetical protein